MIRRARPDDLPAIKEMIYMLADHHDSGDRRVVGVAVWFRNFATWSGTHGIYLEDLCVLPTERRSGHGKELLGALAKECVDNGYTRLAWSVIKWNTPTIEFYESLGAQPQNEWTTYHLEGHPLSAMATNSASENSRECPINGGSDLGIG